MNVFDWPALCQLGMARLGLKPKEFWALTPAELKLLAGLDLVSPRLGQSGLKGLMERFPDEIKERADDGF